MYLGAVFERKLAQGGGKQAIGSATKFSDVVWQSKMVGAYGPAPGIQLTAIIWRLYTPVCSSPEAIHPTFSHITAATSLLEVGVVAMQSSLLELRTAWVLKNPDPAPTHSFTSLLALFGTVWHFFGTFFCRALEHSYSNLWIRGLQSLGMQHKVWRTQGGVLKTGGEA